ncbi:MAG: phosphoribosyl-AMP cyclohydrolase / phosphoribosyl-ATP pyrophosphohydrolase [Thermosediminibacterales bacterium]|nr:phosphoribosyl-AMP cyclohydrolase / phosphoribosyl-ATP pyrophosphohydrolase [Thermosediminibacterales bacterium]MDK2835902.1 phosphoribosyl-AMP cyclohydrolase / phosphoribosyl-ATP pyrophosphohydrolase [Thermosediminibacterales bacterium]
MIDKIHDLKFGENGLIPAIIQEINTGQVLMLAYMNKESLEKTIETGETWFWSRSRKTLWHKGETSGHTQKVKQILYDCDGDTLLVLVEQNGPACHTGNETCFFTELISKDKKIEENVLGLKVLKQLQTVIEKRYNERPEGSYVAYLFNKGLDKILKKVGEEASEVIIASKNKNRSEIIYEVADLLFHLLVMLKEHGIPFEDVLAELSNRRKG